MIYQDLPGFSGSTRVCRIYKGPQGLLESTRIYTTIGAFALAFTRVMRPVRIFRVSILSALVSLFSFTYMLVYAFCRSFPYVCFIIHCNFSFSNLTYTIWYISASFLSFHQGDAPFLILSRAYTHPSSYRTTSSARAEPNTPYETSLDPGRSW